MDDYKTEAWTGGDDLVTKGLSRCTALALWDKDHFFLAHIPPGRLQNGQIVSTSLDLISEYTNRLTTTWNSRAWSKPRGLLLASAYMGSEEKQALEHWFSGKLINVDIKHYTEDDYEDGYGVLRISREGNVWPPAITFK